MALMNKRIITFFAIIGLVLIGVIYYANLPEGPAERESVAVTIYPLYDIVRNIAPEEIDVVLLLPPGASPHTFEPSPSTIQELERSKAMFAIGHGLDDWAVTMADVTDTPVISSYSGINLRQYEAGGHVHEDEHEDEHMHEHEDAQAEEGVGHDHVHEGTDPHYWLSMQNAIAMTATINVELAKLFPELKDKITARHNSMLGKLRDADHMIKNVLTDLPNRKIVTLHDAWYYYAEDYGLEVAATFEPSPGREPTPQYLAGLHHTLEEAGTKTLYSEPQLSTESLEQFVEDNDLNIAVLDPLGGTDDRMSYIAMMLYNARTIAQNQ
jgi:ABC-type Zn uptake system ZnuABC Zn-binding protein ZnuA